MTKKLLIMNSWAQQNRGSKSQANGNMLQWKKKENCSARFVDNRQEAIVQRKLQEIINNSYQKTQASDPIIQRQVKINDKTYQGLNSLDLLVKDLREYIKGEEEIKKYISKNIKEQISADLILDSEVYFATIGDYLNDLLGRSKGRRSTKPKFGEEGYEFKPQTSGTLFSCMEGAKAVNSNTDNKINWGHIGLEREEKEQNVCGANNMAYTNSFGDNEISTINRDSLQEQMTDGQKAGSFLASALLKDSGFKSEMTELQLVTGTNEEDEEVLMMGGNTDEGNHLFKEYIGKDSKTLDDMYKRKFGEKNKEDYLKRLEALYNSSEEFKKGVDGWDGDAKSGKLLRKRKRDELGDDYIPEFRKKRKLRNAMKKKPTTDSKHSYGSRKLIIPNNKENKHTETNLLHYAKTVSIKVEQAIGTKVPCLSCFAAFCKAKKSDALLPAFGYLWFSESSISQHVIEGIEDGEFTIKKAITFLSFIEECLTEYLEEHGGNRYSGSMGNINADFNNDDSESEGEEYFEEFYERRKRLKEM